jgi:hypothetical protein
VSSERERGRVWPRCVGPAVRSAGAVTQLLGVLRATDTCAQTSAKVARSRLNELL